MIKNSKIQAIIFLLLTNLVILTGITITVQAASLQNPTDMEAVKMLNTVKQSEAKRLEMTIESPTAKIVLQIQDKLTEIEEQKALEAKRLFEEQETARYNQELLAFFVFWFS